MRILYHHRTLGDGAEGIHIKEMVNAFRLLNHEVLVIGPSASDNLGYQKKNSPYLVIKKAFRGPAYEALEIGYNLYNYLYLKRIVAQFKPDFIYDRYITFNYSCVGFGRQRGIPVFLEVNSPLAYERDKENDETLYLKPIAYGIEKRVCQDAFKTIVVSTPLKNYLISKGVPSNNIFVLPNGVNRTRFKPSKPKKDLRERYQIFDSDKVIGFVGILRPWHGIDLLMDAFLQIRERIANTKLLLVGDGPIREELEKKAKEAGLGNNFVITGRVPHEAVSKHVALFDIAVSPKATFYASPMKIPEYMAQKKPVVAPDTDNIKDLIDHQRTGFLFKNGSSRSLAETILFAIKNSDIATEIVDNAYMEVERRLNWENSAKVIIDLYSRSIKGSY